jgi:toxin secretion/phage lysis holin
MDKIQDWIVGAAAAVAGFVTGIYGGWTQGTRVLVILMVIDYILGCACGLWGKSTKTETGHFLSQVAFKGLLKKAVEMLVILLAVQLDKAIGDGTGHTMFRTAAEFFYIATEGLSIVENAGLLGVPIPKPMKNALEALREKSEGKQDDTDDKGDKTPEE